MDVGALLRPAHPVGRGSARARGLVDHDAAGWDASVPAPLFGREAEHVALLVRGREGGEIRHEPADTHLRIAVLAQEPPVRGHVLPRVLDREPEPPRADPPEKRLEAGAQEPFRPRRGDKRLPHPLRPVGEDEDQCTLESDHARISASGRRDAARRLGPRADPQEEPDLTLAFPHPKSLGQASVGRGVRDDGAEGLEVEPVRGEREPEAEQHPTACEAVLGRAPRSRDPADRRRAAHAAQVDPPRERADETWTKDAVAMEEESDERRREAEAAWREAVSARLRRPFAQVRPGPISSRRSSSSRS